VRLNEISVVIIGTNLFPPTTICQGASTAGSRDLVECGMSAQGVDEWRAEPTFVSVDRLSARRGPARLFLRIFSPLQRLCQP